MTIPKVLAQNSGFDTQEAILMMKQSEKENVGLDIDKLGLIDPE